MKTAIRFCSYLLLLLLLNACDKGNNHPKEIETPLRPVRYINVSSIELGSTHAFSGLAKAGQESNLSFRLGGTVKSIQVEVGDKLTKGQLIAELDDSQYQLEAQQAVANLSQANATLRNAQANFERTKGLYENNNASRNDLDSARATAESNRAQVRAESKALELARLNVSYTKLKASQSCSVATVPVEVNENVTAGQTVVSVTCGERLEVELAVPESMIALMKRGMDVSVVFSALSDKTFTAKVTEVGVASTAGATYPVTVSLTDKPNGLRSGLAAQVSFDFDKNNGEKQLIIPAVAVGEDSKGRYVYLLDATEQANVAIVRRQPVTIGELTPGGLEVTDGIVIGDKVVVAGVNVIREGLKVLAE